MHAFRTYTPPTQADLASLKTSTGLTGNEFAALLGLADGRQWRKYTGGADPRSLSAAMLFTLAAQLELSDEQIERVVARMRAIGAEVETIRASQSTALA